MVEWTSLNNLWFVVSPQSPFKQDVGLIHEQHRLKMVKIAIKKDNKFSVSDIEFKMEKPNYTYKTLQYFSEQYPDHEFSLIIGEDNLANFDKWDYYDKILDNYQVYVYPRENAGDYQLINHPNIKFVDCPLLNISATFIRDCLKNNKSIRYLLPGKVRKYLMKEVVFNEFIN